MANTKKNTGYLVAALVVTAIIAFIMVSLLTGNITPLAAIAAILFPVWIVSFLVLWCTVL